MTKLGIVKNYLKFKLESLFGVIGCDKSNISYLPNKNGKVGSLCMIGFAEDVIIWNIETNKIVETIHGPENDKVTFLTYFNVGIIGLTISIGYESGYVSVYSLWNMERLIHLKCHKHSITYIIHCKPHGEQIICGSKDTSITFIDIPDEKGFELKGHNSPITKLHYVPQNELLISSSQDGNIKFWNVQERHCFKTVLNPAEVWDFHYCDIRQLLITGSSDALIRLWKLEFQNPTSVGKSFNLTESLSDVYSNMIQATFLGEVKRASPKRIVQMKVDPEGNYLTCNTAEKKVEIYKILSEAELKKRLKKKSKKAASTSTDISEVILMPEDRLKLIRLVDLPARCKSLDVMVTTASGDVQRLELLTALHNNTVAALSFDLPNGSELAIRNRVKRDGHRTAIIYAQFTEDRMGLFTLSPSEAKLWEKDDKQCISTIGWPKDELAEDEDKFKMIFDDLKLDPKEKLEPSSALLLPGDRHAVIGFKNGLMLLFHFVEGCFIQAVRGHREPISALVASADKTRVISSSVDKTVKTWKLEYGPSQSGRRGRLQLALQEEAQFDKGISCIATTFDSQLLVVAFLDNNVRTFLTTDTKRRILDLHGHTEPVTSISVKFDNSQILTGSSDKTVRAWNLPFGDYKTFRGHTDPVTDVRFVPGRSMAFSADKGGLIIQIDVKNMTQIIKLRGHGSQITCLAIAAGGTEADDEELGDADLVSVGTDCSIRWWSESEEILSKEAEDMDETDAQYEKEEMVRQEIVIVGAPRNTESNILTKKTINTERCADELIEALDSYDKLKMDPRAEPDQKMVAMGFQDPDLYVLEILMRIKSGDLEMALAQLPLPHFSLFYEILAGFVKRNLEPRLANRCLLFLGKLHFSILTTDAKFVPSILTAAKYAPIALANVKDLVGFNLEAFKHIQTLLGPELVDYPEARKVAKSKKKK